MSDTLSPAVVLRTRTLREADLIVVLLTPGYGKVDCIARGARRSRRRFPGGLPIGARGEAQLGHHERSRGSLMNLNDFAPSTDHAKLGRDLELFAHVAYLCELSDQLIGPAAPDPTAFARLCEALAAAMEATHPAILRRYELCLLEGLGLLPALERCSVCGSPVDEQGEGVAFSRERGGALCLAHSRATQRIPAAVLRLAVALLEGVGGVGGVGDGSDGASNEAAAYAELDASTRRGLRDLCRELLGPHLRGPLRSRAFFAQLPR